MWSMLISAALLAEPNPDAAKGYLVAVGGGVTTNAILDKTLALAGGTSAKVAVIAEAAPDNGPGSVNQWKRMQASKVSLVDPRQPAAAVALVREANLIWIPGGLQGVFMHSIAGTGVPEAIRDRYRDGGVIGGTSAGAAVMSRKMIGGMSNLDTLRIGATPFLTDGLGVWPEVIVDQHFLQKGRFNRLVLAVNDFPELVGIGIDEETAAVVHGHEFEVMGEGNVTVVDARKAQRGTGAKGDPAALKNLRVHVLRSGMKFRFDE